MQFGRKVIYTDATEITRENIIPVLANAFITHLINRQDIITLDEYYRGKQKILEKVKEIRPEINHKVCMNYANEIVSFKVGFYVGKPITYISTNSEDGLSKSVARLNDTMRFLGMETLNRELVEWQMKCGVGYRLVLPNNSKLERVPFKVWTLDPKNTFVIRDNTFAHNVIAGVYYTTDINGNVTFTVYTDTECYEVKNSVSMSIVSVTDNPIGLIPIIEYPANTSRLGAFEIVIPLLDAINELESNRLDSVQQFVESLLVAYNCNFEDGTTANSIREAGMIVLRSIGEAKADVKVISEVLDQSNTQTFKTDLVDAICEIVGMPQQNNRTSDSSNNGAVYLKSGWQGAETRAEEFEMMFKQPEMQMLRILSIICDKLADFSFDPIDIDIKFTRRQYEDLLSKSQTLVTLLNSKYVHPKCAYAASGLFTDSEDAYRMGMDFQEEVNRQTESEFNEEVNEPSANG